MIKYKPKRPVAYATGLLGLQQLSIKRTTRKFLKALLRNAFKNFLGFDCKIAFVSRSSVDRMSDLAFAFA